MRSRLLLDTYVVIKLLADPEGLSAETRMAVETADEAYASVASLWEIEIKVALGKIPRPSVSISKALARMGVRDLPILAAHTEPLAHLPPHHRDPFDRMLVCQAIAENLTLVTPDVFLQRYGVNLICC